MCTSNLCSILINIPPGPPQEANRGSMASASLRIPSNIPYQYHISPSLIAAVLPRLATLKEMKARNSKERSTMTTAGSRVERMTTR